MKLADRFVDIATRPVPLRTLIARRLLQQFPIGSWERRLRSGAVRRPHYAWCLHYAALQAKGLGYKRSPSWNSASLAATACSVFASTPRRSAKSSVLRSDLLVSTQAAVFPPRAIFAISITSGLPDLLKWIERHWRSVSQAEPSWSSAMLRKPFHAGSHLPMRPSAASCSISICTRRPATLCPC